MIETIIKIDLTKTAMEEKRPIFHSRWHPDIPPMVSVKSGTAFKVECFDFSGKLTSEANSSMNFITKLVNIWQVGK